MALIAGLWELIHPNHPSEEYGQYLCTNSKQGLIYKIRLNLTKRMGKYFVITDSAFTDKRQKIAQ